MGNSFKTDKDSLRRNRMGSPAAVLRAKECVMKTVTNVRENAEDVYAEAKDINERRAEAEAAEVIEDEACPCEEAPAASEEEAE